jgi:hypothetical protein
VADWTPVLLALAAAVPGIAAAIIGLINRAAVHDVHQAVNSRLDQLLAAAKQNSLGEGIALGRQLRPDSVPSGDLERTVEPPSLRPGS